MHFTDALILRLPTSAVTAGHFPSALFEDPPLVFLGHLDFQLAITPTLSLVISPLLVLDSITVLYLTAGKCTECYAS